MVYSLTWLPEVLDRANLKFSEVDDWRSRGRAEMGRVRGVMIHHTVGPATGNMPSLKLLMNGRPDLRGPLAQLGLGRDGTFYIIAAGRANHAGEGKWSGISAGNSSFIGIEVENTGKPDDAYPPEQMDALRRGVAAILKHISADASMVCGHKEYAPGRKIDPLWEMAPFREAVAKLLAGGVPPATPIPLSDDQARPTLRRGARGPIVATLQALLGIDPTTGNFGPVTEARAREWQRGHGLVPDGIVGPKTWASFDKGGQAPAAAPSLAAPAPTLAPTPTAAPPPATTGQVQGLPPADDAGHVVRVEGGRLFAPDGTRFGSAWKAGFKSDGHTGIDTFAAAHPEAVQGISPGNLRAMIGVMGNEGKLELVNSYDGAFMSFGIMQWTAGVGAAEGELPALLARLQRIDAAAFQECFGRFGLGAAAAQGQTTGRLLMNGRALMSAADKGFLRGKDWAYRFWRAGHHPSVRRCQILHAASRMAQFSDRIVQGYRVRDWMSSELGMAMMLDQHVNNPAQVPRMLDLAVGELIGSGAPADPAQWSQADLDRLIARYLARRNVSKMTSSADRAKRMADLVKAGKLSAARNSFA